jgi:ABC-type glycerol-3-phosphate transport system substrate-binding protein
MTSTKFGRRRFLAASAAVVAAPYIRTSHAAGKLSVGFWDHWVPGANNVLTKLCNDWAAKERVDLTIDYITSQGNKLLLTGTAEAQARSGHDVLTLPTWYASAQAKNLEPMDDIVKPLIAENGNVVAVTEYLGKQDGHWVAVPATPGSQVKGPCARIDLFKQHVGLDLTRMYPAGAPADKALTDRWTWDNFLLAAEKCFKAGYPFGLGLDDRLGGLGRRAVRRVWGGAGRRQGQHHGEIRCHAAGARVREAARPVSAARRVRLG